MRDRTVDPFTALALLAALAWIVWRIANVIVGGA
jgi:hypothetical protein